MHRQDLHSIYAGKYGSLIDEDWYSSVLPVVYVCKLVDSMPRAVSDASSGPNSGTLDTRCPIGTKAERSAVLACTKAEEDALELMSPVGE